MKTYFLSVLIGMDQMMNTWLGGSPDETISSRCGRGYGKKCYWTVLGTFLNWLDPDHLKDAVESEHKRKHLPEDLR